MTQIGSKVSLHLKFFILFKLGFALYIESVNSYTVS